MRTTYLLLLLALNFLLCSCQRSSQPSFLIIALEDLSSTDVICTSERFADNQESGFSVLCNESVRYTHAYTPSTMAVPTLASVFTGVYPIEHQVRHNGSTLSPRIESIPEFAVKNGYRTGFFSGGAPVLRKSGLHQGFELFDDFSVLTPQVQYQKSQLTIEKAQEWIQDLHGQSFFSVLYLPDLLYTNTQTVSRSGEVRNYSFDSQLEEVDENLFVLFQSLKDSGRWNSTNIFVLGTSGNSQSDRPMEPGPMNLHSENTQVALFIKPAGPQRDLALSWKIDRNVTLVDVGQTLRELLGMPINKFNHFPTLSLVKSFMRQEQSISIDRPLLIESSWPQWRYETSPRFAFVKDKYVWIYDSKPKIYNTLVDHFENNPLNLNVSILKEFQEALSYQRALRILPFPGLPEDELEKHKISFATWMREDQRSELTTSIKELLKRYSSDTELKQWQQRILSEQSDSNVKPSALDKTKDVCGSLAQRTIKPSDLKDCSDELWVEFISWVKAHELGLSPDQQRIRFEQRYWQHLIDMNSAKLWLATSKILDLNLQYKWIPNRTEIALRDPQWQKQQKLVQQSFHFLNEKKVTKEQ